MFQEIYVNTMAANGLVPHVARVLAALVLATQDKGDVVIHKETWTNDDTVLWCPHASSSPILS